MFFSKHTKELVVCTIFFVLPLIFGSLLLRKPADRMEQNNIPKQEDVKEVFVVAIGDSLTEGVGDSTNEGGYVPLLQSNLMEKYPDKIISTVNYGKAGNTTRQIIKRINSSTDIQNDLKEATIITLTTGGNDLMKVIKSNLFNNLAVETFDKPSQEYQEDLDELYQLIRQYNDQAPIYQLGIYNPFYVSFNEIDAMQEIVDNWNGSAKSTLNTRKKAYFVPINDNIYDGLASESSNTDDGINNLLSDADNFHPNNLGYQIIANEFAMIIETSGELK
ncbi:SGNH/GDSL hydrolase family protein [Vagococcus xieshaowenii]|uniref:Lipase n=1 Tax=Vagococcus xieshaowenii TaxID=2562451 RepID=A0AAJ5EEW2_9ENTE|nr:SGNH/GDSL hydrolase family protein [Vagococcus xieshaowenii]QCA28693.1 lipase [Vagococcus xieshaowenii]TFZ40499.1 lipase [Vagococcus xieshaowenii]